MLLSSSSSATATKPKRTSGRVTSSYRVYRVALAETFGWRHGIDSHFRGAPAFYTVVGSAMLFGMLMDFAQVNPVKALYWTAVINGLLAPFLLTGILLVASDSKLMRGQPSSLLGRGVVGLTTVAMFGAAIAMFVL